MKNETYRFLLRMPESLRERLVDAAASSGRSLNAELVHRLERSLEPARRPRPAPIVLHGVAVAAAAVTMAGVGAAAGWEAASVAVRDRHVSATRARGALPPLEAARRAQHLAP